jgi:redox-sensitive bicupin YhaK (pirin superfamily)
MSWLPSADPILGDKRSCDALELVVVPRVRDLGDGFEVRRALPSDKRQMVGPFIFFDQMGPAQFLAGHGLDVRPHPHIGLATVTYLFDGQVMHRDSEGNAVEITPGAMNLMTAGRGIAHSERTPSQARRGGGRLSGIQSSRVGMFSDWFYAEVILESDRTAPLDPDYEERAIYVVEGEVVIAGESFEAPRLLIFRPGDLITVRAKKRTRVMFLGGSALEGPRYIWWNFVSSRRERIEQAKEDWKSGRFAPVPGEIEFIPLPES